jgi:hypothetical protein
MERRFTVTVYAESTFRPIKAAIPGQNKINPPMRRKSEHLFAHPPGVPGATFTARGQSRVSSRA